MKFLFDLVFVCFLLLTLLLHYDQLFLKVIQQNLVPERLQLNSLKDFDVSGYFIY